MERQLGAVERLVSEKKRSSPRIHDCQLFLLTNQQLLEEVQGRFQIMLSCIARILHEGISLGACFTMAVVVHRFPCDKFWKSNIKRERMLMDKKKRSRGIDMEMRGVKGP
jgi:hypothetical protein